jgi:hypothetical protein
MPTMQLYSQKISSKHSWAVDKKIKSIETRRSRETSHIFPTLIKSYLFYILNEWYAGSSMENKFLLCSKK